MQGPPFGPPLVLLPAFPPQLPNANAPQPQSGLHVNAGGLNYFCSATAGTSFTLPMQGLAGTGAVLVIVSALNKAVSKVTDNFGSAWLSAVPSTSDGNADCALYYCQQLAGTNPTITITLASSGACMAFVLPVVGASQQFFKDSAAFHLKATGETVSFPTVYSYSPGDIFVTACTMSSGTSNSFPAGFTTRSFALAASIFTDTIIYLGWSNAPAAANTKGPVWGNSASNPGASMTIAIRAAGVFPDQSQRMLTPPWPMPQQPATEQTFAQLVPAPPSITITPSTGGLTLSGVAPTLNLGIAPLAGAITLSGVAPTMVLGTVLAPPVGTITLADVAPVLNLGIAPLVGTITLAGAAPTLTLGFAFPPAGTITLTGQAPVMNLGIAPLAGAITLTGVAPTLAETIAPSAGTITLSGGTPSLILGTVILPGAGSIVLSGVAPTMNLTIVPPAGAIVLSGNAPVLGSQGSVTPQAGSIILTGVSATQAITATPSVGAIALSGVAPVLHLGIAPQAGAIALSGAAPGVVLGTVLTLSAGAISLAGVAPLLALAVLPSAGSIAFAGGASALGFGVTPIAGALGLVGAPPAPKSATIAPATATLTLIGSTPGMQLTGVIAAGALSMMGYAPTVTASNSSGVYLQPAASAPAPYSFSDTLAPSVAAPTPYSFGDYLLPEED